MCGIVAYHGPGAEVVNLAIAAKEAAKRGPHSWGWAWWDGDTWQVERGRGPLGVPCTAVAGAQLVVGHSRLATCGSAPGDAPPPEEGQPLVSGDLLVAHNGTVPSPEELAGGPVVIDSEAILRALEGGSSPAAVVGEILGAPQALVLSSGREGLLYAVRAPGAKRAAHPLYVDTAPDGGTYLSSRSFTARCRPLPEGIHRL